MWEICKRRQECTMVEIRSINALKHIHNNIIVQWTLPIVPPFGHNAILKKWGL
jgi:hypothetical protein